MNCKQGDLAIVVRSKAGNEGKIVRCVRWIGNYGGFDDVWGIDIAITWLPDISLKAACPDSYLRPLRGDLLDEETGRDLARVVSA